MSTCSIRIFDSILRPLQIFGLQFISINSVNQFVVDSEKFYFGLIFVITFPLYSVICSYYYIYGFINFEDVASTHNFLQYELKIITYAGRYLIIVTSMLEAFGKSQKVIELWRKGLRFQKIMVKEFGIDFRWKYSQLKAVMQRRLIILFIGLTIVELVPQISPNLTLHAMLLWGTKFLGSTIISLVIFKQCFYVDFVNLYLNILAGAIKSNLTKNPRKLLIIQQCYIEIMEMERLVNEAVSVQLPITISIIIMCLVRRAYRLYALFTGQLHFSAFVYTILNNMSEEVVYVWALCYCCNRTEVEMSNLMEALRKIDCTTYDMDQMKVLSFFSDQVLMQPVGFYVMNAHKINIEYLAEICTGILSYVVILLQFERIDA